MTSPMDAGLMGQRIGVGANGTVVTNQNQQMWGNPSPQNNFPPMTPPVPTGQPMGPTGGASIGDQSPMEAFQQKWFNSNTGGGQQQSTPTQQTADTPAPANNQQQQQPQQSQQQQGLDLSNLTAAQFNELARNMDFTQGVPDDIMAMFQPDENGQMPNMMQGMMGMMNHVARQAYAQALAGSGRLAGHGIKQYGEKFVNDLPSQLRKHQADGVIKSLNIPSALKPSVEGMVNHMLSTNPNATPEQLTEMLEEFMGMFGGGNSGTGGRSTPAGNGIGDLFN